MHASKIYLLTPLPTYAIILLTPVSKFIAMVTMNDIAARTGVSRSTVSCVLNGRAVELRIPDVTQQRVREVASELGYRHNEMARSIAGGKSRMIGFITGEPGVDVEFKSRVMVGVIEAAAERGYTVQVLYLPPRTLRQEVVERCIEWRLAGVVTLALHPRVVNELHREISRYDMAMAVLEDSQAYSWAINVSSASSDGMRQAVDAPSGVGAPAHRHAGGGSRQRSFDVARTSFPQAMLRTRY